MYCWYIIDFLHRSGGVPDRSLPPLPTSTLLSRGEKKRGIWRGEGDRRTVEPFLDDQASKKMQVVRP